MDLTFQVPVQYCFFRIGLYFYHQSYPQLGLFLLWFHLFILSGVISLLISSIILNTYQSGGFIFQCPIFLPFHTVHGVLKARILRWFAIPFSSGPCFVRTLHHDPSILGHSFIELDKALVMWSDWLVPCDCGFHSVCCLMKKDKRLMEASWCERLTAGEHGSCSDGQAHAW